MTVINVKDFEKSYNSSLKRLKASEQTTKAELLTLSRSVLDTLHGEAVIAGDIGYINRLIQVLTPVNRKVAVLYFKAFAGFDWSDEELQFTKKNKKSYADRRTAALKFLEDPLNNIWTWAERNIDVEQKPLDLTKIAMYFKGVMKKAEKEGIDQKEIIKAVFKDGVDLEVLMIAIGECFDADVNIADQEPVE